MRSLRRSAAATAALLWLPGVAAAQDASVEQNPLASLLGRVRAEVAAERKQDEAREAAFLRAQQQQARILADTEALVAREEAQSLDLDTRYGNNELEIEELGERLNERLGQMGELFGVVRLVSTDLSAQTWDSLTSLGHGPRNKLLDRLGRSSDLPSTEDLEELWYELQLEMTEQGRVARYRVPVIVREGMEETREVLRAGPFTATSGGEYLQWEPAEQRVRSLERPPPPRYAETAVSFGSAPGEIGRLMVDPSRGTLLEALTATPSLLERLHQGGSVGYTIVGLGLVALLLGLARMLQISQVTRRVSAQVQRDTPSDDNPLGRLLGVYRDNRGADSEILELKLDETLLRERNGIERYLWIVQTISIVAPLLGLLGTVTGMIQTFQAITLFGAGDPKIMAGGISEALVTTTLGLMTAIPLVLLYALVSSRVRNIMELLDEKSTALIAQRLQEGAAS